MWHFALFLVCFINLFYHVQTAVNSCINEPLSCPNVGKRVVRAAATNNTTMTPTQKEVFVTTSNVIGTLAEAKLETLAEKFLKIDADKFIRVLKCFSIAGNVLSLFIQSENADTKQIIGKLQNGFDKLTNQMNTQFANLEMVLREQFFDLSVYNPVQAATKRMNQLMHSGDVKDKLNRALFVSAYEQANMDIVVEHILKGSKQRFRSISLSTNYNEKIFNKTTATLTSVFFQTYAAQAFLIGLASQCMNGTAARLALEKEANKTRVEFNKLIKEATDDFHKDFFPGTVKENIVRKVVDKNVGKLKNDGIAKAIIKELRTTYPWRHYAVIVSNGMSGDNRYYQFGFDNRRIIEENYNGKNVIVFMNTPGFLQHAKNYRDKKYRAEITKTKTFGENYSLKPLTKFIAEGKNYSQIAVIKWGNDHHCESSHPEGTDMFNDAIFEMGFPESTIHQIFYVVCF